MGRPGFIEAQAKVAEGQLVHAGLGGHVVITGTGELDLLS